MHLRILVIWGYFTRGNAHGQINFLFPHSIFFFCRAIFIITSFAAPHIHTHLFRGDQVLSFEQKSPGRRSQVAPRWRRGMSNFAFLGHILLLRISNFYISKFPNVSAFYISGFRGAAKAATTHLSVSARKPSGALRMRARKSARPNRQAPEIAKLQFAKNSHWQQQTQSSYNGVCAVTE